MQRSGKILLGMKGIRWRRGVIPLITLAKNG